MFRGDINNSILSDETFQSCSFGRKKDLLNFFESFYSAVEIFDKC